MMTVQAIYQLAIELAIKEDPRGAAFVRQKMKKNQLRYTKLSDKEKQYYDKEYLTNPYSDTRVLYASKLNLPVRRVLAGIDADGPELLLAKQLGNIDLVISHHPEGIALSDLHTVMDLQVEVLEKIGVPVHLAEGLLQSRIGEVLRGLHPVNAQRAVDTARLLDQAYMSTHTTTDNLVTTFFDRLVQKHRKDLDTVSDLMELIMTIPEYQEARRLKFGPEIFIGNSKRRLGRIAIEMTGGTNGSKEMFEQMSRAGVGTIVGMHMREDHKKEAEKYHINVVIAGHMPSDSLGMNLFLDEIEKQGVEIVPAGGLIRVRRFKSTKKK